jgi:ketosteroid isomerase-like protein
MSPETAFAAQPGSLAHGSAAVRESLAAFVAMKGTLDLKVTRVLEAGGLALVAAVWSFTGTGSDGKPVTLTGRNGDVLRRQADGSWRFVIDNPWGTDRILRPSAGKCSPPNHELELSSKVTTVDSAIAPALASCLPPLAALHRQSRQP